MCGVAEAAAGASLLVNGVSAILGHSAQQEQYEANRRAAEQAAKMTRRALTIREMQETQAAYQSIAEADREARRTEAMSRVMAGESGVQGISVGLLLDDIERKNLEYRMNVRRNLQDTKEQLRLERLGALSQRDSRIAAVPPPNYLATGLRIIGYGIDSAGMYLRHREPTPGGRT